MSIRHKIRTGRDVDNNLYMQLGSEAKGGPSGDRVIGHICHGPTARDLVEIVNRAIDRRVAEPAFPGQTGADLRTEAEEMKQAAENVDAYVYGLLVRAAEIIEKLSWVVGADGRIQ